MIPPLLWRYGLVMAVGAGAGVAAGKFWWGNQLVACQQSHQRYVLAQEQNKTAALAAATQEQERLHQQSHALGVALLEAQSALATAKKRVKERIVYVTQNDGSDFTGLGPDGLRLYREALGYPAENLPGSPSGATAPGTDAPSSSRGLPPTDLISHAADYGQWCQNQRKKLEAWRELYTEGSAGG